MARPKKARILEGEYVLVDAATGKIRGRSFKRLAWAEAHRDHLEATLRKSFQIAKVVHS